MYSCESGVSGCFDLDRLQSQLIVRVRHSVCFLQRCVRISHIFLDLTEMLVEHTYNSIYILSGQPRQLHAVEVQIFVKQLHKKMDISRVSHADVSDVLSSS